MVIEEAPPVEMLMTAPGLVSDRRDDLLEHLGLEGGPAVLGVPGVQVDDRGTGVDGGERLLDDLLRRDRQIVALRGHVDRARHRDTDDHLIGIDHSGSPSFSCHASRTSRS
jgi:hypothetical protein